MLKRMVEEAKNAIDHRNNLLKVKDNAVEAKMGLLENRQVGRGEGKVGQRPGEECKKAFTADGTILA